MKPYKVSFANDGLASASMQQSRWETGTANIEGMAGITAVIEYFASLGTRFGYGKVA